ncbi:MAG: TonB-dependent receptor [Nitrospirota bacterium]|nr:TonB-dependent receptor [Nitrospirota bacterium]
MLRSLVMASGIVLCLMPLNLFAKEGEEGPVEVREVTVIGQPVERQGTGTLNLDSPSTTSSRLGLTLRQIPASIEVIGQQTIQERGFRSISEAIEGATGVTVGDAPGDPANFSMRGFTNNQIRLLNDGLMTGPANMTSRPRDAWNLDRIEILKGPASVLYGEGAVAGAINFVTKRPVRGLEGTEALLSYGTFNTTRAGIGSGGRLGTDTLHYRTDLSYQNSDNFLGVQRAPYTYWNWTSALLYDMTSRFSAEVSFDLTFDRSKPYFGTPLVPSSFATQGVNGVVSTLDGRTVDARMLRQNYNTQDSDMSALTTWTKLKTTWQPTDLIEVRNQAYYYTAKRDWQNAETYTFNASTQLIDRDRFFVQHDQSTIGDRLEFQVNQPIASFKNRFVTGLDFSHLDFTRPSFFSGAGGSVDPFAPVAGLFGPITAATQKAVITTIAMFAEDQLSLTDQLKLIAGFRHDHIELTRELFDTAGVLNTTSSFSRNFNPTTWRAGLVYDLLPEITLYGQYATAADPAASNIFLVTRQESFTLATGAQWEVGAKGDFWNKRAEWTVAYFDIFRKNILTQTSLTEAVNVGRQSSKGIELAMGVRPTDAWRVQGNLTFLSAKFDDFAELSGGDVVSRTGNRPFNVPQAMANLWSIYRLPTAIPIDLGAAIRYVGNRYSDAANSIRLHGYTTADAWLTVPYKNLWFTLRGRNLLDKTYASWGDNFYPTEVIIGSPRTVELSLMARF